MILERINIMNTKLKHLQIGDLTARLPIIQGGMGVGVSLSKLAGAVAKEGGVGIISTAQIGYDEKGFEKDQAGCNRLAIRKHIQKAKEIACAQRFKIICNALLDDTIGAIFVRQVSLTRAGSFIGSPAPLIMTSAPAATASFTCSS